jgi:hypothetical protein
VKSEKDLRRLCCTAEGSICVIPIVAKLKPYEILIIGVRDCDRGSWILVERSPT